MLSKQFILENGAMIEVFGGDEQGFNCAMALFQQGYLADFFEHFRPVSTNNREKGKAEYSRRQARKKQRQARRKNRGEL